MSPLSGMLSLCYFIWHVSSRNGEACCQLLNLFALPYLTCAKNKTTGDLTTYRPGGGETMAVRLAADLHPSANGSAVRTWLCCRQPACLYIGRQWRDFVPYLCQLIFAAILWVKTFVTVIAPSTLCGKPVPSVLWRCWLGGRKGIRPVKNWVVGCWRGYLSGAYGPADATASQCLLLQ